MYLPLLLLQLYDGELAGSFFYVCFQFSVIYYDTDAIKVKDARPIVSGAVREDDARPIVSGAVPSKMNGRSSKVSFLNRVIDSGSL